MSRKRKGWLVAFEGIEGAGKSTQIRLAAAALESAGHHVRVTVEPGGTELGRVLRKLVLERQGPAPTALAELFLYLADRTQHVTEVIEPALKTGEVILTDRFSASTIAYQGYARELDLGKILPTDAWARLGVTPDLNVLLDCPVEVGLARAHGDDRFHSEAAAFHERVRQGFLAIAAADRAHWWIVDATRQEAEVHRRIMEALRGCVSDP